MVGRGSLEGTGCETVRSHNSGQFRTISDNFGHFFVRAGEDK